jgi:hypothetical protein
MEETMAELRPEDRARDAKKTFQAAQSASTDVYQTSIDLFRTGMERSIEVQKRVLDIAAQQNADALGWWRSILGNLPNAELMFDFAQQTVEQFFEMQKRTLDIVGQQSAGMAESARTQGERIAQAAGRVAESATTQWERKSA